jgi:hypothetical protein
MLSNVDGQNVAEAIDINQVNPDGTAAGSAQEFIPPIESALSVSIATGGMGFVVTWINTALAPTKTRISVNGDNFVASDVVIAGDLDPGDQFQPRAAWAASSTRYLVVWSEANASAGQDVWAEMFDAGLGVTMAPMLIGLGGSEPKVASDGTDFWVVWTDASPAGLSAGKVTAAGVSSARAILGSGGTVIDYDIVAASNGVQLLWAERGGTLPALWDVPVAACAL